MTRKITRVEYNLNPCKNNLAIKEIKIILRCTDGIIGRGGRSMLAKILKGSKDKKIIEYKLDSCPGYGYFNDLSIDEITSKIDRLIKDRYLDIEYDGRFPLLYFTETGWDIEKNTYSDELFEKLQALSGSDNYDFVNTLKDRDRGLILLLLEKIAESKDQTFIPVLEFWKTIDYKKVQSRINNIIDRLKTGNLKPN